MRDGPVDEHGRRATAAIVTAGEGTPYRTQRKAVARGESQRNTKAEIDVRRDENQATGEG